MAPALLDMFDKVQLLDSAATDDAMTVATTALLDRRDALMDGPSSIRKICRAQFQRSTIHGYTGHHITQSEVQILLRYAYLGTDLTRSDEGL